MRVSSDLNSRPLGWASGRCVHIRHILPPPLLHVMVFAYLLFIRKHIFNLLDFTFYGKNKKQELTTSCEDGSEHYGCPGEEGRGQRTDDEQLHPLPYPSCGRGTCSPYRTDIRQRYQSIARWHDRRTWLSLERRATTSTRQSAT